MLGCWGWKKTKQTVSVVLPEKSVFFIDKEFSSEFKHDLMSIVALAYGQTKNPELVIADATLKYPEIMSMKVQICQTDKICFYIQAAQPLFLFNDMWVVCDNRSHVAKDHFSQDIVQGLIKITSSSLQDIDMMVQFVQKLPDWFKSRFSIEWLSENDIKMLPVTGERFVLRVSADAVPSVRDVDDCLVIGQEQSKKIKTKKKTITYDVRFKNQIIVQ